MDQCQKCFFQFVYTIFKEKIYKNIIIHANQIGVVLISSKDDFVYRVKGLKQMMIYEKDKKCVFIDITSVIKTRKVIMT